MRHSVVLLKHWEPLTKRQNITSQKFGIITYAAGKNSNELALYEYMLFFTLRITFCVGSWKVVSYNK
jgi:hypothetical protein